MELYQKKEHIYRCVTLGMDLYSAYLLAECTDAEIDLLNDDPDFQRRIAIKQKLEERNLLERFDTGMGIAVQKGNVNPVIWKLGILNPDRYNRSPGNKDQKPQDLKDAIVFESEYICNTPEEIAGYDNVEIFGASDKEVLNAQD